MTKRIPAIAAKINKTDLFWSAGVVVVWRCIVQIYAVFVLHRFPFSDTIHQKLYFLSIWKNYDGGHYTSIAEHGYSIIQYAFFPLYPLLIKIVSWPATVIFGDKVSIYIVAGLLISTLSLIGAVYFMLQIARHLFTIDTGKRAVFLLLFFPSAIFLAAVYTESLFLCLVTGSFYLALKQNWGWAALLAALAALTRSVGAIMFVCLAIEFYVAHQEDWRLHWPKSMPFLMIPGAVLAYMAYQWVTVGTPLQFLEAQKAWGREVDGSIFSSLWKDYVRGFNLLDFKATRVAPLYDGLATVFGVVVAGVLAYNKYWSFAIFTLAVTVISLVSGTTVGAIRYVIVAFPAFLLLGHWGRHQTVHNFLLAFFAIFFAILSVHYLNSWWLA